MNLANHPQLEMLPVAALTPYPAVSGDKSLFLH